jgi:hypothetical protein
MVDPEEFTLKLHGLKPGPRLAFRFFFHIMLAWVRGKGIVITMTRASWGPE